MLYTRRYTQCHKDRIKNLNSFGIHSSSVGYFALTESRDGNLRACACVLQP